jgi:hypothetical protein
MCACLRMRCRLRLPGTVGTVPPEAGNGSPFRARPAAVPKPPVLPTDVDSTDLPKLKAITMKFSVHNRDAAGSHRNRAERDRGLVKTLGTQRGMDFRG